MLHPPSAFEKPCWSLSRSIQHTVCGRNSLWLSLPPRTCSTWRCISQLILTTLQLRDDSSILFLYEFMKQFIIQFSLFPQNAMRFWQCSRGSSKVALASISLFVLVKVLKVELVEVAVGAVISIYMYIATCLLWANLYIDLNICIYIYLLYILCCWSREKKNIPVRLLFVSFLSDAVGDNTSAYYLLQYSNMSCFTLYVQYLYMAVYGDKSTT